MEVVSFLVFVFGFVFFIFLAFYKEYKRQFKKHKPEHFGLVNFQRVTRWETSEWQDRARRKGITLTEWQRLCEQQLNWVDTALDCRTTMRSMV